jgi:hypothetical protein
VVEGQGGAAKVMRSGHSICPVRPIYVRRSDAARRRRAIRQEVERRLQEIQLLKQEAINKGQRCRFLPEEELAGKVPGPPSNPPYILGAAWYDTVPLGGSAGAIIYVANSGSTSYLYLLVSLFFGGLSNLLDDIALGPASRNQEWPYVSTPPFTLASGGTTAQSFPYNVPGVATLGTYIGNAVLWAGSNFAQGVYLGRFWFDVTVT